MENSGHTALKTGATFDPPDLRTTHARPEAWPYLPLAVFSLLAGLAALAVDMPLARWCADGNCPRDLARLFQLAEAFAHGAGVAIILLAAFLLDPRRRWALPRLVIMALCAGMVANLVKLTISRTRPRAFDLGLSVTDSFEGWFPAIYADSAGQSLPSAHTATACALAVGLVWLYPRGRWLFPTLALLAACQRIVAGSHFLSDVFWGAAIGWLIGAGLIQGWLSPGWLNRWEAALARRFAPKYACEPEPPSDAQPAPLRESAEHNQAA